tara:strand:+ start:577 stop:1536 length:960 start_codon:yes stop_codon:yes gene_type:complete
MKKKILLITGDPNSINSEIICKTLKKLKKEFRKNIFLISNYNLLVEQFRLIKCKEKLIKVDNFEILKNKNYIKVFDINLKFKDPFNVPNNEASRFVLNCLDIGHKLASENKNVALVNCPINKTLIKNKGLGITEYLAKKNKLRDKSEVMLIKSQNLAVCPITTHIDIKNISKEINKSIIIKKVKRINNWYMSKYKKKPQIAILGLNPHNAELKKNSEEKKIIIPAIKQLSKNGFKVQGPLVSDTIFINNYRKFDVIVGMFHDQVLAPFKTLFKFDAINLTLGLKYLRVSPDHGTARELIKKNKASSESLQKCIEFINKY